MSGTKIRKKISLIKVISILTVFVFLAVAFLAPSGRIEWSEKTLGIKEEYYANVSLFQLMSKTDVQIHSKTLENMDDIGNSLGISQGDFDAIFGTLDLSKLEKEPAQLNEYMSLIIVVVMFVALYIFIILPQKKVQKRG